MVRQISPIPENISADVNGTGHSDDQELRVLVEELKQAVTAEQIHDAVTHNRCAVDRCAHDDLA